MSEQQPGQGNVPVIGSGAEEPLVEVERYYYDYVGRFLASDNTPEMALGTNPQAMHGVFVESKGNYLTPANTFRVLEQVAQGPTDLVTLKNNIPTSKTAVTRTVNFLSAHGVVGKSEWIFALDPEAIRETGDRVSVQNDNVTTVMQAAESLSEGHDETIYVTKERFLEHLTELRPDLAGNQEAVWNAVVFQIQRQYRAWTNGIEFTSTEARNKRQMTVALTPEFQQPVREMMATFVDLKQDFTAFASDVLQNNPLLQKSWSDRQQRFENEQERTALLSHCAEEVISRAFSKTPAVDAILAIGDGEFDIKDAFWPRMIFGYGYEPRRQQVPYHSWRNQR